MSNHAQHLVPQAMAVKVVDRFEMIEIEHEHGAAFVLAGVARPVVELFEKASAIGKPGQRVMPRQPLRLHFGKPPLVHFRTEIEDATQRKDDGGNANKK